MKEFTRGRQAPQRSRWKPATQDKQSADKKRPSEGVRTPMSCIPARCRRCYTEATEQEPWIPENPIE